MRNVVNLGGGSEKIRQVSELVEGLRINGENAYKRLYAVPKNEILNYLLSRLGDEQLLDVSEQVRGEPITLDELRRSSHTDLIQIAASAERFTEDDALYLHEEFRYRGTKTFYLYSYPVADRESIDRILQADDLGALNEAVLATHAELEEERPNFKYDNLELRESDRFNVEDENLWELVYSYVATVRTTDPETEESQFNPDLRFGFIWVNRTTPWLMISAKDEAIAVVFAQALARFFDTNIARLPIPKSVEVAVESYESVRRASHVDGRGVRTRIAHQQLHIFPDEVEELQQRDQSEVRTSSGYNVESGGIRFALGYSREKGAISFSKLLRTTLLRQFGVQKLTEIYLSIQEVREHSPDELIPFVVNRVLAGSWTTTKASIEEVIVKLATARQSHLDEIDLGVDPFELARLGKYFTLTAAIQCADCDDLQNIQCSHCEAERFLPEAGRLICARCDTSVEAGEVRCVLGHEGYIVSPHEAVTLYPTRSLLTVVEQTLDQASQTKFNRHEENFLVRGTTLHVFGVHGEKTILMMEDIPEFQDAAALSLSPAQESDLVALLRDYREKCGEMSYEACGQCVQNRVAPHCLMRLYGLYDHRYTPRPHHGREFGDVSLNVTIDGHPDQTLVILLKKGNPNGHPITIRHGIGKDLFTQLESFWTNPNVSMIGIAVPQRIDDGFIARLQRKARGHNKKLGFFGVEELAKIVQFVLNRDGLGPEEL
ncbi:MAG: hypothetical protein ACE5JU_17600 [Candidatus Binatia bacterium]